MKILAGMIAPEKMGVASSKWMTLEDDKLTISSHKLQIARVEELRLQGYEIEYITKPDYIPFSQEIFDECENMRAKLDFDMPWKFTPEYVALANKLADYILSDEYSRYLKDARKARGW
jgi:hypothetical protein